MKQGCGRVRTVLAIAAFLGGLLLGGAPVCQGGQGRPEGFVDVAQAIPTAQFDIRYFGAHNFLGEPVEGYRAPKCLLTQEAAAALARVQEELQAFSLSLKIYDCYRPQRAVDHFVRWAKEIDNVKTKAEFYPTVDKRDLFKDGFIAERSGHSRGSTVDLTIVPVPVPPQASYTPGQPLAACTLPAGQRFGDNSVDMGTGFDCFHALSHPRNPASGETQRLHRMLLWSLMDRQGFKPLAEEWWHFTLRNEPFPETYFDFPVE
jgi:D-alanyl-D-alanine dipeptidase